MYTPTGRIMFQSSRLITYFHREKQGLQKIPAEFIIISVKQLEISHGCEQFPAGTVQQRTNKLITGEGEHYQ